VQEQREPPHEAGYWVPKRSLGTGANVECFPDAIGPRRDRLGWVGNVSQLRGASRNPIPSAGGTPQPSVSYESLGEHLRCVFRRLLSVVRLLNSCSLPTEINRTIVLALSDILDVQIVCDLGRNLILLLQNDQLPCLAGRNAVELTTDDFVFKDTRFRKIELA
jgi:hypothetical protein